MESTSSINPINISISRNNEKVEYDYNEFKEYIIKNNINLQNELRENILKIKDLEKEVSEKESIEDKYDNRIRYMKGLLQNLNELRNDYSKITTKTEKQTILVKDLHKTTKKKYYTIYIHLILLNILTLITPISLKYINIYYLILQTLYFIYLPFSFIKIKNIYYSFINDSKTAINSMKDISTEINIIKLEIKNTEDACLSIDNWICEA